MPELKNEMQLDLRLFLDIKFVAVKKIIRITLLPRSVAGFFIGRLGAFRTGPFLLDECMSRQITSHVALPGDKDISIIVTDAPGAGGANHLYMVQGFNTGTNVSCPFTERHGQPAEHATILFQNGPIKEVGTNGVTNEALLAVVADRLRSFQSGPFSCRENALALTKIEEALHWLHHRTLDRVRRGVEGVSAL